MGRPPAPPEQPLPQDCCESGCDRCVFVVYEEEMALYRQQLVDWETRHAAGGVTDAGSGDAAPKLRD